MSEMRIKKFNEDFKNDGKAKTLQEIKTEIYESMSPSMIVQNSSRSTVNFNYQTIILGSPGFTSASLPPYSTTPLCFYSSNQTYPRNVTGTKTNTLCGV